MKIRRTIIILAVILTLLVPASMASAAPQKHANYKGMITAVNASSITLELKDGSSATLKLTPETKIRIPTLKNATAADLAVGMTVIVQTVRGQGDSLTAKAVLLIPGKPVKTHRVGTVKEYTAGVSISIEAKDGKIYAYSLTTDTKILPAERVDLLIPGALVTIIAPRDVATLSATPPAVGIVVHPASSGD